MDNSFLTFIITLSLLLNACSDLSRSNRINDLEKEVAELKAAACPS
jgi:hypothetical protein